MKQTAVDYLIQELFTVHDENFDFNPVFEKAKEMEKEQICNAYNFGQQIPPFEYAEQYYNETFKSE
jgi:hypothetical protein